MLLGLSPGIEVVGTAADGEEAVELARSLTPDVVLMDLRMPRTDGVAATRRIVEELSPTRVIVLTTAAHLRVQRLLARNWNLAISGSPLMASSVASRAAVEQA